MKTSYILISLSLVSLLGISSANATVHVVTCQNSPSHFLPVTVNALVGDTIHWIWVEGGHIVGPISSSDIPAGAAMFNAPIDYFNQSFEYVVTVPGSYHYDCHPTTPHGEDAYIVVTAPIPAQIINGGFELWDTTYTGNYSAELSSNYAVPEPLAGVVNHWTPGNGFGMSRTTDSYSGNYALILHNWYSYVQEWITYREAANFTPRYLQGYYKYSTGGANGLSHATATVTFTRFNGTKNDTIASGTYQFDSAAAYTPFQMEISLTSQIPDSFSVYIINSNSQCALVNVCNLLYLDNLAFADSALPVGVQGVNSAEELVTIYPNPFTDKITIETPPAETVDIYNSAGRKVKSLALNSGQTQIEIDFAGLTDGIYFYSIVRQQKIAATGKLLKSAEE